MIFVLLSLSYVIFSVTLHSSAVPTTLLQFPLIETAQSGGAVLLTAYGRSDSPVHQSQRGIVIGDIFAPILNTFPW